MKSCRERRYAKRRALRLNGVGVKPVPTSRLWSFPASLFHGVRVQPGSSLSISRTAIRFHVSLCSTPERSAHHRELQAVFSIRCNVLGLSNETHVLTSLDRQRTTLPKRRKPALLLLTRCALSVIFILYLSHVFNRGRYKQLRVSSAAKREGSGGGSDCCRTAFTTELYHTHIHTLSILLRTLEKYKDHAIKLEVTLLNS